MPVYWKPHKKLSCEDGTKRTVFIKGEYVPMVGWMATPDTFFSCPAFVMIKGKRCVGYISSDNMFCPMNSHCHMMPTVAASRGL